MALYKFFILYCIILYSNSVTLKSKLRVSGHSRSLETEPLDGSRTTYVNVKKNCCFITTCKAHSIATHKTAKIFSSPQEQWIQYTVLIISTALEVMKIFVVFLCVTVLWALYVLIKQQFFYIYICSFSTKFSLYF